MMLNRTIFFLLFAFAICGVGCDSAEDKKGRFLLKGNAKMEENDYKGARDFYNEALQLDPEFSEAYYNRGITYLIMSDYDHAIEDFSKAISLKNKYSDAYYQRGLAYLDFGEYYKSLSDANALIKLEDEQSSRGFFL